MTISSSKPPERACWLVAAGIFIAASGHAADAGYHLDGHLKTRFIGQSFPGNSIFNDLTGSTGLDLESDLRLNFEADSGPWSINAAYQLFALYGDRVEYSRQLPPTVGNIIDRLPNDAMRAMDLTHVIHDSGRLAVVHRLDRLWLGYTSEKTVVRFGRQAITWGNGFFFAPMDIVNPFDPATIDTEYKAGDDMLYAQYLRDNGHDVQAAVVVRRNLLTGDIEADERTIAVKYHGILGDSEFDLLAAESFGDATLGAGGNRSIGGAVWRADVLLTDARSGVKAQFVTNASYSWTWGGMNATGVLEYYYNGFGLPDGRYDLSSLGDNPELLERLATGQTFSVGRHYLAGGVSTEITPLWMFTPNVFLNLEDGSALLQFVTQHSLGDDVTLLGALNLPVGPDGSEYGGLEAGVDGRYFSIDFGVFLQLAWYF